MIVFTVSKASANEKVIPFSKLPAKAQTFVKTYFKQSDVAAVTLDTEYFIQKEYAVIFKDGSKVEFDGNGAWESIDMKTSAVPATLIPQAIQRHVQKSFPDTFVQEIKQTRATYEVEISNGLDLEFSRQGEFLKVDD